MTFYIIVSKLSKFFNKDMKKGPEVKMNKLWKVINIIMNENHGGTRTPSEWSGVSLCNDNPNTLNPIVD